MLIPFCLGYAPNVCSQPNPTITTIRNLSPENGLASKLIYCGLADSRGFVWLGTSNGLQRYDGERFRLFTREKNGLQDNNPVRMAEGPDKTLWLLYGLKGSDRKSAGMLDILDLNTYEVTSLQGRFGGKMPFQERSIQSIACNEKKEIAIVTRSAGSGSDVYIYGQAKTFRKIFTGLPIDHGYPHHLIFRDSALLFYGSNQSGILFTGGTMVLTRQPLAGADNFFPLGINKAGRMFGSTSSVGGPGKRFPKPVFSEILQQGNTIALRRQLFAKKEYADYNEVYFRALYESRTGGMLLYQQKMGLLLFDGENFRVLAGNQSLERFQELTLYDFFSLSDNQYWICTSGGVIIIDHKPNNFRHLLSHSEVPLTGIRDHQVRSIYADSAGNVFINSWGGFFRVQKTATGNYAYRKLMSSEKPLFDGFYFDGQDFWIASGDTQVIKYRQSSPVLERYVSDSLRLWSGITTREGSLLIGAVEGIGRFTGKKFERIRLCEGNPFRGAWVYQFFYSHDGILWAVSNKGLFTIGKGDCVAAHYAAESDAENLRLPISDIHHVYEDDKGTFWMATNGGGLIKWDRRSHRFEQFTIADGLSSNVLYAVLEDTFQSLWISSEYGLMRFNKLTHTIHTYTKADGITDNEFNRISYFKGPGGELYFGGLNGVTVFDPADFRMDSTILKVPLEIISFSQFDGREEKLLDRTAGLLRTNSITMQPQDKFFTIEFQLLDYKPGSHRYAYMIEGVEKDWNYIESNSIRISGLPYGSFTLRIKGQNADGQWSKTELRIPLNMLSPLTGRWWFRGLSGVLLIGLIYLVFRIRTRGIKRAKLALEHTVKERTRQLNISLAEKELLIREVHHRVNNNLQVISALLELEEKNTTDKSLTNRLLEGRNRLRSIALIHQNLYKNENVAAIEINSFIEGLCRQVKEVFHSEVKPVQITYALPRMELDIETAVPLGLVLNELLTNSFKYAFKEVPAGEIQLTLQEYGTGKFMMVYRDNGPGLPKDYDLKTIHTLGMQLIFDLMRQIGGNAAYEYAQGCKFNLFFTNNQYRKNSD